MQSICASSWHRRGTPSTGATLQVRSSRCWAGAGIPTKRTSVLRMRSLERLDIKRGQVPAVQRGGAGNVSDYGQGVLIDL